MPDALGGEFASILDAARSGGEWALERLYRAYDPAIRRYVRAQVGDAAEDVASETWLAAARNLATFDGDEDAFRAWLFTIAKRRAADHLRSRSRRDRPSSPPAPVDSAEQVALDGRLGDEAAQRIVANLPPEQAQIVLLRVVAGLSVEEVAAIVGRRPGTVRVLQHRALRRLAEELPEDL